MTKFEVLRAVHGVEEFSTLAFDMVTNAESAEDLQRMLSEELSEEGLQTIRRVAQRGNYPLSLEGLQ